MATNDVLDRLEALLAAATPGPWFRGSRWKTAGTHPPIAPTRPTCAYCDESEPAEVIPYKPGEKNGCGNPVDPSGAWHRHPNKDAGLLPTLDDDGSVLCEPSAAHRVEGPTGEDVCCNYDYESGGVVNIPDAELIVALRNAAPALIRLARGAMEMVGCAERSEKGEDIPQAQVDAMGAEIESAAKALGEIRL